MEENNDKFLDAIREADKLDKEDEKTYLDNCKEFAQFIVANGCRQVEVEGE